MPHNILISNSAQCLVSPWRWCCCVVVTSPGCCCLLLQQKAECCCWSLVHSLSSALQCGLSQSRHQHQQRRAGGLGHPGHVTTSGHRHQGTRGQTSANMSRGILSWDTPHTILMTRCVVRVSVIAMFSPPLLPGPGLAGPGCWALYSLCRPLGHTCKYHQCLVSAEYGQTRLGCVCCLCLHVPHVPCYTRIVSPTLGMCPLTAWLWRQLHEPTDCVVCDGRPGVSTMGAASRHIIIRWGEQSRWTGTVTEFSFARFYHHRTRAWISARVNDVICMRGRCKQWLVCSWLNNVTL